MVMLLLVVVAACRGIETKPTIVNNELRVTKIHPCIKKVRVTITQGAAPITLELSPVGGSTTQKLPASLDPTSAMFVEVEILETDLECVVQKGDVFSFQGVPTAEGNSVYALPLDKFFDNVITAGAPGFGVSKDCLDAIIKRLRELAELLGIDIKNKRIEVVPTDNSDGGGFETLPDPNNTNRITIKVTREVCALIGTTMFDLTIAHELDHISRYGTPGNKVPQLREEARVTRDAAAKAVTDGAPDALAKKRKAVEKEIEFLEALIEEEKRAYDSSEANKDKLGLSDDDLKKNKEMRDNYIEKLEKELELAKRVLAQLPP